MGAVKVGVKLYAAVQDRDVHFTLLERKKHAPVEQRMVKPDSDEAVAYAEIRKGFLTDGSYVMLERGELTKLAPKPSREIEIESCVSEERLGPEWFVRPYYLGPDGDLDGYGALVEALRETKREGIAHWVMRGVEYSGVLRSDGEHLLLITLRHQDEVVDAGKLPLAEGRAHSDKEAKMAEQLILAYEDVFDASQYRNEHRERVLSLIEAKAKGKRVRLKPIQEKKPGPSLVDALQKSLARAHKAPDIFSKKPGKARVVRPSSARAAKRKERAVA